MIMHACENCDKEIKIGDAFYEANFGNDLCEDCGEDELTYFEPLDSYIREECVPSNVFSTDPDTYDDLETYQLVIKRV